MIDNKPSPRTTSPDLAMRRLPESTDVNDVTGLLDGFKVRKEGALRNAAAVLFCKEDTDYMQCLLRLARFKGKDNQIFIDNKQITGNIFRLIDAGMAFCFNHLSLSGVINGTYREEHLEIPAKALREAFVNALVHRLYVKRGSSVSLAIYDDRVEIINPGTFPSYLTMAELRAGNMSELRNPTIAKVMYSRKTVETWGRGIKLILDECAKANLPEPQILAGGGYTRTVFMRPAQNNSTKSTPKTTQKTTLKTTQKTILKTTQKILNLLRKNPNMTRMQISEAIGLSLEGVKWNLGKLKASGIIRRVGPDRGGHWEIVGE